MNGADGIGGLWFVLGMNDMRSSNIEKVGPIARARSIAELQQFIERERCEPYQDDRFSKAFRRGGPLEWKNDFEKIGFGGFAAMYVVTDSMSTGQLVHPETAERIATIEQLDARAAQAVPR